jgi:hypothetical protein
MPYVQYVTFKTERCEEGWDGERICATHDYAWTEGVSVCNSILNAVDVDEASSDEVEVKVVWEEKGEVVSHAVL